MINGNVRPLRDMEGRAEAIAVSHGRVAAVGRTDEVLELRNPATVVHDLRGHTVVPGFIDPHIHFVGRARSERILEGASTRDELRARLVNARKEAPHGSPVIEYGTVGDSRCWPTKKDLNEIGAGFPLVAVLSNDVVAINDAAAALAGTDNAAAYSDGVIRGQLAKVTLKRIEENSDAKRLTDDIEAQITRTLSDGISSVHAIVKEHEQFRALQELQAASKLRIRVGVILRGYESEIALDNVVGTGLQMGWGNEWLRFQGVKVSVDGYFPSRSARFCECYDDDPENQGMCRITQDELNRFVRVAHENFLRCCVHVNGDEAADMAIEAFGLALRNRPRDDHRHRLEHYGNIFCPLEQVRRVAALGLVAVPNPPFMFTGTPLMASRLGDSRSCKPLPVRQLQDVGVNVVAASDFPALPPQSPLKGISALVNRHDRHGVVRAPEEALSVFEAMRLYSSAGAWAGFEEHEKGTIEVGKLADFAVLQEDPLDTLPEKIHEVEVIGTIVGGEWRYGST